MRQLMDRQVKKEKENREKGKLWEENE